MIEPLKDLPEGIQGVKASGVVSRTDYTTVIEPMLAEARQAGRRVRFLYEIGPGFESFSPGAAWEDVKVGLRSMLQFDGCAIVTDVAWVRESTRLAGLLMPCAVRVFGNAERAQAVAWLEAIAHRLIPDLGVLVVDATSPLRVQDIDALTASADAWIEAHGELRGLVVHAREFPGWENLAGFLSHLRFIREHHRKIGRVALAADSKLATLAPRIAEHFVKAELKAFDYGALDDAIAWAGGLGRGGSEAAHPQA